MESIYANLTNKTLQWQANPSCYDYIHNIFLDFDSYKFTLTDGGGQKINAIYKGTFEVSDSQIILNYQKDINPYVELYKNSDGLVELMNLTKRIGFIIVEESVNHFDGYCKYQSKWTMKLESSPFVLDCLAEARNSNLFNQISDDSYPLTFYSGIENIPCNVRYERSIRDELQYKKYFVEMIDETRTDVLENNSEEIRKLNSSELYRHWQIIHLNQLNGEIIICGPWQFQPIFIVKNKDSTKYYVPNPQENFKYNETTNEELIKKYSPKNIHPITHSFNQLV